MWSYILNRVFYFIKQQTCYIGFYPCQMNIVFELVDSELHKEGQGLYVDTERIYNPYEVPVIANQYFLSHICASTIS